MTETSDNIQAVKYHGRPTDGNNCRSAAEQGVYDFLDRLGIDYVAYCHRAAFTMEECAAVRNGLGVPVFKNLFLTNRQQTVFFLLILPADKPFKTKHLSSQLGCARLSFASAEAMEEYLHIKPGAVSPMGLIFDTSHHVKLIIDRDLASHSGRYACHPCVNTASIAISLDDLLERILPATGHDFKWVDLPEE
jgi:Ala-tRNA(Pro) deacylase